MNVKSYDLVVIGSGPAGEKGAAQAAYFGKSVALIEKDLALGGAAANTGTLPSKTLRESALYLSGFRQRGLYGIEFRMKERVSARDFLYRERLVVQSERSRIADNLKKHRVDLYRGRASFVDPHTIAIQPDRADAVQIRGSVILIATGSHPYRPNNLPFHDARVYDSDTILNIHDLPPTILVAGGGVIGCEYACMFSALGIKVSLVEGRERLLAFMDAEITQTLTTAMREMGVDLHLADTIEQIDLAETFRARLKSGKTLTADAILAATGRVGNTESLALTNAGIKATARGNIEVNDRYQTPVPHIYAVGDVIGFPALASTSMEQARVAMVHAFDLRYKTQVAPILPYGIYTIPECSMAGAAEEELTKKGIPFVAGRARYSANARGQIIGDDLGFLKLLFHADDMRLLGVHIIGEQASELVHIGLMALNTGSGADLFIQTCFNYPTLSEIYKYATYDALGQRAKRSPAAA
ncbi:MAG: Si-specific NAD(P)(+) transhydrogenase [Alphaproteobacteria bacterium]|nr:Si-specific NAD(P)(+) transhydrogenase [Alphaproteobacteria bacterium]